MLKIVVGGQMGKDEIKAAIEKVGGAEVSVDVKNDLDAVMGMKNNSYDYYFGACNTGGGGALAMAIALLGKTSCLTAASPNGVIAEEEMLKGVNDGMVAFGFTPQYTDQVVPIILNALLEKNK